MVCDCRLQRRQAKNTTERNVITLKIGSHGAAMLSIAALAAGLVGAVPAAANESSALSFPSDTREELAATMQSLGIDATTAESLIVKLENGILPDSISAETPPASVETYAEDGSEITRYVYPDGSVSITSVEFPSTSAQPGEIVPLGASVSDCVRRTSGSTT